MATTRKQPITVLGLGLGGVNLVKNALILDDNEVTLAQNAVPFSEDGGVSGIRKRDGLQRVVPTGSVTPGSDAGGAILGGFVVDDPLGSASPEGGTAYTPGYYLPPGGVWTAYSPDQTTFPAPNACYNYRTGFSTLTSVAYPPVPFPTFGAYYYGGHESGQILEATLARSITSNATPFGLQVREIGRVAGTGSTDDTFVLPLTRTVGRTLFIALAGGGCALFNPVGPTTTTLPSLAATVTGAVFVQGRIWVVSGLKVYSLGQESSGNYESAWSEAATVSDSGITQLFGLSVHQGVLFAGSYSASGPSPTTLRVYAFDIGYDGTSWTATARTFPSDGTTGPFNGPASVQISAWPAWVCPYPVVAGDARLYAQYEGTAGSFVQLLGAQTEDMAGTSLRILSYDGLHWHNGADTGTDDVWGDAMGSVHGSLGPLTTSIDGRIMYAYGYYSSSGNHLPGLTRLRFDPNQVPPFSSAHQDGLPDALWSQPVLMF